jgi:hypothetical protein
MMSSSQALYNRLFTYLREVHPDPHVKRISNWVWIMVGIILSHSVHLSKIAQYIPSEAQAAGRIAQIRRWLSNRFVDPVEFYRPLISRVLQSWVGQHVFILIDGLAVNNDKLQVLRVSLSHAYRALPLGWLVLEGKGPPTVEQAAPLLREIRCLLKAVASVTLIADRGFHDVDWAIQCLKYGWNYLIRVANNTQVCLADGQWLSIKRLGVKRGQRRYFANVLLTRNHALRCNLMVTWTEWKPQQERELCAVITNQKPCLRHLQHYLLRMHIEQSFRDDQSGSCELAKSKLRDPERLNHLLLACAVVTLWMHQIGQEVWQKKQRKQIDPAAGRQLSIFQLGWRTLQRAVSRGLVPALTLCIRPMRLARGVWRRKYIYC